MITAHIYNLKTGRFTGRQLRGAEDWCGRQLEEGQALYVGEVDWRHNKLDTDTGKLVKCRPDRPADTEDTAYTWDDATGEWLPRATRKKLAADARAKRDQLLAASDWVTLRAADSSSTVPAEWRAYRAALRDITNQAGFPSAIDWPQAPDITAY